MSVEMMDEKIPITVKQLNQLMSMFEPLTKVIDPLMQAIKPIGIRFDNWFEGIFGKQHALSQNLPLTVPHYTVLIIGMYLSFVFITVPLFSMVKFSIKLKPLMKVYNTFMVLLSGYMCITSIQLAMKSNDSIFCVPIAKDYLGEQMAQLVWIFTYSKVIEFLDTVFMIFEGRMRQVSFLHIYHHFTILLYWFTILWMAPGSDAYFSLAGNSFIHVLMYGYYLLASFGYSPWWKFYITKAQILQFCCFCVQSVYVGYVKTDKVCDFPDVLSRGLLWYMLTLIGLFTHFLVTNKKKKNMNKKQKNV